MNENTSKVYVLPDERSRILRCEGGYTMSNIVDISQWVLIDEGYGDRHNLCQNNYFSRPLYEEHGIPVYKLNELDKPVERTPEEIAEDVAALPPIPPSPQERIAELEAENYDLKIAIGYFGVTDREV